MKFKAGLWLLTFFWLPVDVARVSGDRNNILIDPQCLKKMQSEPLWIIPDDKDFKDNCITIAQTIIGLVSNLQHDVWECLHFLDEGLILDTHCPFNLPELATKTSPAIPLSENIGFGNTSWYCPMPEAEEICDGHSYCLTDECNCLDSDTFYCADGTGCISWSNLCNDIQDCKDGSDECFCHGHVDISLNNSSQRLCVSEEEFCQLVEVFAISQEEKDSMCEDNGQHQLESPESPIYSCMKEIFLELVDFFSTSIFSHPQEYCRNNCSHVSGFDDSWQKFCDHIALGYPNDYDFLCVPNDTSERYQIEDLCDGTVDCSNEADEIGCPLPDRFYCNPGVTSEWVDQKKVCDNVKDCINGTDECGTCDFGVLSSSEFLIQSKIVLVATVITGILIIVLNIREGYTCWTTHGNSNVKSIDRIFLMQIFFYDTLMGLYLCLIVLAAILLKLNGDYCSMEQAWRASIFCSLFGVIFSFSSHGSLIAIASVSITRFLSCHWIRAEISKGRAIIASVLLALINFIHSILPLVPLTCIRNIFRTGMFFTELGENPFFSSNPVNMTRLTQMYKGMHDGKEKDVYTMIRDLRNVTSRPELFDFIEISYYGNTGLCVHNIFKSQGSSGYEVYKVLYCSVIFLLLVIVTIAYIMIVLKQRASSRAVHNVDIATRPGTGSPGSTALTLKVALMIGSQLFSWIPFILTVLYFQYVTKTPASPKVFETFALIMIPINSFLNPVFYSEIYKKVQLKLKEVWRKVVDVQTPMNPHMEEAGN